MEREANEKLKACFQESVYKAAYLPTSSIYRNLNTIYEHSVETTDPPTTIAAAHSMRLKASKGEGLRSDESQLQSNRSYTPFEPQIQSYAIPPSQSLSKLSHHSNDHTSTCANMELETVHYYESPIIQNKALSKNISGKVVGGGQRKNSDSTGVSSGGTMEQNASLENTPNYSLPLVGRQDTFSYSPPPSTLHKNSGSFIVPVTPPPPPRLNRTTSGLALFPSPPPTSHELQFFSVTSGFTRLHMKTKYIYRGLISLYVSFCGQQFYE